MPTVATTLNKLIQEWRDTVFSRENVRTLLSTEMRTKWRDALNTLGTELSDVADVEVQSSRSATLKQLIGCYVVTAADSVDDTFTLTQLEYFKTKIRSSIGLYTARVGIFFDHSTTHTAAAATGVEQSPSPQ